MKDTRIEKIINHFGINHQLIKLAEECSELTQAALKYRDKSLLDNSTDLYENLVEEIADVEILIAQIKSRIINENQIKEKIEYKLNRTLERIS